MYLIPRTTGIGFGYEAQNTRTRPRFFGYLGTGTSTKRVRNPGVEELVTFRGASIFYAAVVRNTRGKAVYWMY